MAFSTPESIYSDVLDVVNQRPPYIIPARVGRITEMFAAVVLPDPSNSVVNLHVGDVSGYDSDTPHLDILDRIVGHPDKFRKYISGYRMRSEGGLFLSVDGDQLDRKGVNLGELGHALEPVGINEVFIGGLSESAGPDDNDATKRIHTTGMIRELSRFIFYGRDKGFDIDTIRRAYGLNISQLAMGMPMSNHQAFEEASRNRWL